MAEDSLRIGGISSGLAVILNGEDRKESSQKNRLISYCDDFGDQSVERTLEHIFDIPYKTISPLTSPIDTCAVCSILKNDILKFHENLNNVARHRDGVSTIGDGYGPHIVTIEESSICGDIRIVKPPLLVESHAIFSSVRANACVWKGKWMYEVILETSGIQQLGWATLSCPFTNHEGVGDADDSYAYDGKRVSKWNKEAEAYGQSWVVGDVIGCCVDLDCDEISFYRNGISLGVAFDGIRKMVPGLGYYPAISLSQGERCDLNFGVRPFRYPIEGFLPIQAPPSTNSLAIHLLNCFSRLLDIQCMERADFNSVEKMRRLKRFVPFEDLFHPVSQAISKELFSALDAEAVGAEYIAGGPFLSFIMGVFRVHAPHDYKTLDRVLDILLELQGSRLIFEYILNALAFFCKTASLVLTECPYSGSYPYLALVCHMLRREELMILWWTSSDFEFLFEGFLAQKIPNKQDLQCMMPSVWWPGSSEDISYESSMMLTCTALSEAVSKIEEKHRDLCQLVMEFIPPVTPRQLPGSVFRTFLQNILFKNRGADHNMPPPGVSSNSVIVSLFTVILHFLSEGFSMCGISGWMKGCGIDAGPDVGFLHRGGQQSFPIGLFLKSDPHRVDISRLGGSYSHLEKCHPVSYDQEDEVIRWEEGCMDDKETRVTHFGRKKPCCCSSYDDFTRTSKNIIRYTTIGSRSPCSSLPERSAHGAAECSTGNLNDEIADKPSTSDQSESEFGYRPVQRVRIVPRESDSSSAILKEEELLDAMLLLYNLGLAPNYKQASSYISHQSQSISLLEETDKQIRDRATGEQLKRLKEARSVYREEVMDCVRKCAWYRISLFTRWKQRGMYAACMWIVQLLLVLSKMDSVFLYVPEFYLETLVDCFHVLRKSDPPYVPTAIFIKQGLASFVTFVVTHFNDPRISSAELRDLLLQSISVLVQYKEFLAAFERNAAATQSMPRALLSEFDNRSWIPVTNILLRLCKGSGFGSSNHGESSTSSVIFQKLLREACIQDEELLSVFLNRLFNTLSWAMTELSISIREIQEKYKIMDLQQRKCSVIFDLSCNLARVLEFCTREIPQAFLSGSDMNLRRLIELIVFILNHLTSVADPEFIELTLRRPGQSPEKVNRGMILAPLAGIILNLFDASMNTKQNDIVGIFASMDCPDTVLCGFQYLLEYNWLALGLKELTCLNEAEGFLLFMEGPQPMEGFLLFLEGPQPMEGFLLFLEGPQPMEVVAQTESANTMENQAVDEPQASRFTWMIENFSRLNTKKLYSEIFVVGGYKWRVLIFPKGNNVDHLSMYLDVADSSTLPYGWCRYAQFSLAVVNQIQPKYTLKKDTQHQFHARESDWGFTSFMSLSELYDPNKGFLMNDTCIIEADVAVRKVIDYWSYDSKKETGYVGLKNQGATCYMNSLLQTLYHIPYFRKAVYHMPTTENDMPSGSIPLALQSLFYKLQYNDTSVATKELTKSFGWDTYDSFMQHDVQELNRVLSEKLEDKMKGTVVEGTIQKLFEGHHMNYIECINVDFKSTRKESFYDLQLDVKGCRDVYASFDKYVEVERLEGDNKYHAEEHGLQDAKKGVLFIDFPPVLQLQLKRFEYDFMRDTMVKINDRYEFPLELDLDREDGKYLSPDADRSIRNLYTLHSVLVHSGGVHGGHYYAFIRPTLSDQWFKFDDERVTKEDMKRALEEQYGGEEELPQTNPGFNNAPFKFTKYSNAYMLVYIRESDKEKIICDVDEKDIAEHLRIRLKKEQEEKEDKRRYKAQAHLYTIIKVARDEDLLEQIGKDIYFDLVDHDKVRSFRIQKQMPFVLFKEEVAKEFGIPVQFQRFWIWAKRQNHTYRPNRPLTPQEEAQSVGQLREVSNKTHNAELKLFLEIEPGLDLHPIPPPDKTKEDILLFFKLYDPKKEELRYVGRLFVKNSGKPVEILTKLNEMAGFDANEEIELYEEVKFEPCVMCERLDKRASFRLSQIEDGDIICFQKCSPPQSEVEYRYPDVPSFLEYVKNRQIVHFRSLERPKEDDFCLELSKLHTYDDVVERVAQKLGLEDPSKIRLTPHNCYSQQPKPHPIKYRAAEHLLDMLVHYNQVAVT